MAPKMQLQCPMPRFDFDVITLGHGSGGLLTNKLLESGVFDLLSNDILDTHHDGATLTFDGPVAFSTDSFVVSPIFFPGGDIGELAVNGTVNDIAMCGARPQYLSLSFILEEGLTMEAFWKVLVSIRNACEAAGVRVVTGDTKVVDKGKGDKIFINTTGLGTLHPRARIDMRRIRPGDKIIVSHQIGAHGVAILSVRQGLEFDTTIESDTAALHEPVLNLLDHWGPAVKLLRDPTRGGLAATLNEIARDTQLGYVLQEAALPIAPEVRAACEILGLDPLYIANEGVFLAIVAAESAEAMVQRLRHRERCSHAAIIGEVVEKPAGSVLITNALGGKRPVSMPVGEQLPRIC